MAGVIRRTACPATYERAPPRAAPATAPAPALKFLVPLLDILNCTVDDLIEPISVAGSATKPKKADAGQGRDLVQQLGDIVAVFTGQRYRERDAPAVGEDVVLAARSCTVDRAGPAFGAAPRGPDAGGVDQSSFFADRSKCSSSRTPASFQAARRPQHVMQDPKPSSSSRYFHWMPVCSTNRIPHGACRSGASGLLSTSLEPGSGGAQGTGPVPGRWG